MQRAQEEAEKSRAQRAQQMHWQVNAGRWLSTPHKRPHNFRWNDEFMPAASKSTVELAAQSLRESAVKQKQLEDVDAILEAIDKKERAVVATVPSEAMLGAMEIGGHGIQYMWTINDRGRRSLA